MSHPEPSPCRVAVVGAGRWGRNIVRDLVRLGVAVTAIDPDPSARRGALDLGAARAVTAIDDLDATGVDAIVVATPASRHEHDVVAAARFGVPVACEKPLTTSAASARRLLDEVGDRLTVLHVWRYHPGVELLGELARSGALGEVTALRTVRANWTSPRTDVDPVWTLLPHDLSIAAAILGSVPSPTAATVERIDGHAVSIWATFRTGASTPPLVVEASTRSTTRRRDVAVHGTEAVAFLGDGATDVIVARDNTADPRVEHHRFDATPALERELSAFLTHVRGGPPPTTDGAEGLAVVAAVEAALALDRSPEHGATS